MFLRSRMDSRGYIPLETIASFNRIRSMTTLLSDIILACKTSSILKYKEKKVKSRHEWRTWILQSMVM